MDIIAGTISALAFGGQGILRHEGLVVFVPFTAIGDEITCKVIQKKKNFAVGELLQLIKPGPGRIKPRCPYFGSCGGCQLQHLNDQKQIEYKTSALNDALSRTGRLNLSPNPSVTPASLQWAYRRHVTLHLKEKNGSFEAGYFATDNKTLIPIDWCPIFTEKSDPILVTLRELLAKLQAAPGTTGRATLFKQPDNRYLLSLNFERLPQHCQETIKTALENEKCWSGIQARSGSKSLILGQIKGVLEVKGMQIGFKPTSFIQNHPEQSLKIYELIVKIALEAKAQKVLDLYCGIGISSLMLAKEGLKVLGVESNAQAIEMAKENANKNGVPAEFQCSDAAKELEGKLKTFAPDLVIVNPPREGLDAAVVKALLQVPTKTLVYVSCMPATLARDLKLLNEKYAIASVQGFDMFPQTAHLETVVVMKEKK